MKSVTKEDGVAVTQIVKRNIQEILQERWTEGGFHSKVLPISTNPLKDSV